MGLSLGISFLRAILLGLGVIGLSGGVAKRSSLTGWKEGVSVRLTALVCLGLSLPTGEPVLGEPCLSVMARCGLELRDPDFLGVPGGDGTGVGPFPLALLSPNALTSSFTDTPCNSAGRGWVTSLLDDLGDPGAGDLVVDTGDPVWAEMSILEGERNPGEAERLPGRVVTLVMSLGTGLLS